MWQAISDYTGAGTGSLTAMNVIGEYSDPVTTSRPMNPVPEPGTFALMFAGLAGLLGFRKKSKK